jgi:hypothetical protein
VPLSVELLATKELVDCVSGGRSDEMVLPSELLPVEDAVQGKELSLDVGW